MPNLDDLYREIILDHYRSPRNRGELPTPPATHVEGHNPLCGDVISLYIDVADNGVVDDVKVSVDGCSISQSSASMMTTQIKGKSVDEVREVVRRFKSMMRITDDQNSETDGDTDDGDDLSDLGDLAALQGVNKFPMRIKCATLSWNTLLQALDEASSDTTPSADA